MVLIILSINYKVVKIIFFNFKLFMFVISEVVNIVSCLEVNLYIDMSCFFIKILRICNGKSIVF